MDVKFHPPTPPFRNRPLGPGIGLSGQHTRVSWPAPKGKVRHKARLKVGGFFLFSRVQAGTPRNPTNIRLEGWRQVAQSLGERNFLASNLFGVRLSQDFIRAKS
jgi:hypothetical protein